MYIELLCNAIMKMWADHTHCSAAGCFSVLSHKSIGGDLVCVSVGCSTSLWTDRFVRLCVLFSVNAAQLPNTGVASWKVCSLQLLDRLLSKSCACLFHLCSCFLPVSQKEQTLLNSSVCTFQTPSEIVFLHVYHSSIFSFVGSEFIHPSLNKVVLLILPLENKITTTI